MAKDKNAPSTKEYDELQETLKSGSPRQLYIFYGQEYYLLERSLAELRRLLIAEGTETFNYHSFEGREMTVAELAEAVEMMPVFGERTLIEVHDCDLFKLKENERELVLSLISDLPDYVCLVFIYDALDYAPDKRQKLYKAIEKNGVQVFFPLQEGRRMINWIRRHAREGGKDIATEDAEYLSFITGGQMTRLNTEIAKLTSYSSDTAITRADIDVCVTPVVEAAAFKLADAILAGNTKRAAVLLSDILLLQESPQKVLYAISQSIRSAFYARLAIDAGKDAGWLRATFHIAQDFQAKNAMTAARRLTTEQAANMVLLCSEAALKVNSGSESALSDLLIDISTNRKADIHA